MKKLILIIFLLPLIAFGQGLFLTTETGAYENGDTLTITLHLKKYVVDFENTKMQYWTHIKRDLYVAERDSVITQQRDVMFELYADQTITWNGVDYTAMQIYNFIFGDDQDVMILKNTNLALIKKYPFKKY